ncbi:hypothetical protein LP52_22925 [Streptomonospora alba]|uniref:Uncharacterized protein n=1 Tax=Streptomonospora alba TaxID=183763 RepID=A0A0C2FC93_9ACTN|nr:hypothetical protein [Streptomonospora alba]KIH96789.1 hypothetical protein LP52_22925 [Streptomonospora alba]
MGAPGGDADTDAEARIQAVAGLALGAFGAVSLYTALARAETVLAVTGAAAGVLAVGFVVTAAVRLRRLHRKAEGAGDADEDAEGGDDGGTRPAEDAGASARDGATGDTGTES